MIRRAIAADIPAINKLLRQVLDVHADGRPDLFRVGTVKYSNEKLAKILQQPTIPFFVAVDENNNVIGYALCEYRAIKDNQFIHDLNYCYLDDICVDKDQRGKGIGTMLYEHVKQQARADGYEAIRLNVWCLNESAIRFYEKLGLVPLSMIMEENL